MTAAKKAASDIPNDKLLRLYDRMVAIRLFEERVNDLYTRALMPGLAHLYIGEEAIAVGVCEALRNNDYITSTHRGHGHCLAKGASPDLMFAAPVAIPALPPTIALAPRLPVAGSAMCIEPPLPLQ